MSKTRQDTLEEENRPPHGSPQNLHHRSDGSRYIKRSGIYNSVHLSNQESSYDANEKSSENDDHLEHYRSSRNTYFLRDLPGQALDRTDRKVAPTPSTLENQNRKRLLDEEPNIHISSSIRRRLARTPSKGRIDRSISRAPSPSKTLTRASPSFHVSKASMDSSSGMIASAISSSSSAVKTVPARPTYEDAAASVSVETHLSFSRPKEASANHGSPYKITDTPAKASQSLAGSSAFSRIQTPMKSVPAEEMDFWMSPTTKSRQSSAKKPHSSLNQEPMNKIDLISESMDDNDTSQVCPPKVSSRWWLAPHSAHSVDALRRNLFKVVRKASEGAINQLVQRMSENSLCSPHGISCPPALSPRKADFDICSDGDDELVPENFLEEDLFIEAPPHVSNVPFGSTVMKKSLASSLPTKVLRLIFGHCLQQADTSSVLLPSIHVCWAWRAVAEVVMWESPTFFSLSSMMKMHSVIQESTCSPSFERRKLVVAGGLRGMLGMSSRSALSSDPKRFLFGGDVGSSPPTTSQSGPCLSLSGHQRTIANRVKYVSFYYFNPRDRKFPLSFDIQSFLTDSLPNLSHLRLSGSPDWVDSFLIARLASQRRLRRHLSSLELISATDKVSRESMASGLPKLVGLKRLVVEGSRVFDDIVLAALGMARLRLEELIITRCEGVTEKGLNRFINLCPSLLHVKLNNLSFK